MAVTLEMGHSSSVKEHIWKNPSYRPAGPEEATHDWEFWIRDARGADMGKYVEKLIVQLHSTFRKPTRGKI